MVALRTEDKIINCSYPEYNDVYAMNIAQPSQHFTD